MENKTVSEERAGQTDTQTEEERSEEGAGRGDDLARAIERLEPGKPLVLNGGLTETDGGHVVLTQYVDIGRTKLLRRPNILVKATEAQYGLEHAPTIRLSAPHRFRAYGETFIEDDQEGRAKRKTRTQTGRGPGECEEERALAAVGAGPVEKGRRVVNAHTDAQEFTFGRTSWIYCTSIAPMGPDRAPWREHLPFRYDHESVIRQPARFARALGLMYADQIGPQRKDGRISHPGGMRSVHDSQVVRHGPVWYADDVFGFLKALESDPLYPLYALFLKDREYEAQREYRFVVHCETPVEMHWLDLRIPGMMRDALAPPNSTRPVCFEKVDETADGPSSRLDTGPKMLRFTRTTRTRRKSETQKRQLKIQGEVVQEETMERELVVALTTEHEPGARGEARADTAVVSGGVRDGERAERRERGDIVEVLNNAYARVMDEADVEDFDGSFTLDDLDQAKAVLEAARRPFAEFSRLPAEALPALTMLAEEVSGVDAENEVTAMSSAWNAIWAICNLCSSFGDVVRHVRIEQGNFVGLDLKGSTDPDVAGRLVVGPRGRYAFSLSRDDQGKSRSGGEETRLYLFPDEPAREMFAEFGWKVNEEDEDDAPDPNEN